MDPVSLVVGALAVGAVKGAGDSAATAVHDAYQGLKQLLASRLRGHSKAELALQRAGPDSDAWQEQLIEALQQTPVLLDSEVVEAARRLIELTDPEGFGAGSYRVDLRGAQGVQVGDQNVQSNVFGGQPDH